MKAIVHSWFTFKSDASALRFFFHQYTRHPEIAYNMLARNQRSNKTRARNNKCTASSPLRNHVRQCRSCTPILCNTTVCIIFVLYFGEGSMDWVNGAWLCTIRTRFFGCKNKIVEKLHTRSTLRRLRIHQKPEKSLRTYPNNTYYNSIHMNIHPYSH